MWNVLRKLTPLFLVLMTFAFIEGGMTTTYSEARSMKGGRSFRTPTKSTSSMSSKRTTSSTQNKGNFSRGLMGGLLGGALGGMLFGSMFGGGGSGMGILPLLILGGIGYFLYRKFTAQSRSGGNRGPGMNGQNKFGGGMPGGANSDMRPPPAPNFGGQAPVEDFGNQSSLQDGIDQIKATDRDFDEHYFTEIASDVFFQVQAGWIRRDVDSYKHLLGTQLASEYAKTFEEMKAAGRTNKLESIAVRTIEVIEAGSDGGEDFVTVRFIASLLDYTVDDATGNILEGSNTTPVKFEEEWTWARPVRTNEWKLEGIK